jgi:hypothetical protein
MKIFYLIFTLALTQTNVQIFCEDYSPAFGIAISSEYSYSDERENGIGIDGTLSVILFNASIEFCSFQKEFRNQKDIISGYLGVGDLNMFMTQIGWNNFGLVARLHGDIGILSLIRGGYGIYPSDRHGRHFGLRDEITLMYSFGYDASGMLGSIGLGVLY